MGNLILPKDLVDFCDRKLIYLAGPILGAPNWQDEAFALLIAKQPEVMVASPRRESRGSLASFVALGQTNAFSCQRNWEHNYMNRAAREGALLFWLPGEETHNCKKVYGATTRYELGEFIEK